MPLMIQDGFWFSLEPSEKIGFSCFLGPKGPFQSRTEFS